MSEKKEVIIKGEKSLSLKSMVNGLRYFYLSYYFSVGCIQSFQSIIFKKVGLSNSQIGTIGAIGLVGGIISPVSVGFIADKTKKSKLILTITVLLSILSTGMPITVICFTQFKARLNHEHALNNNKTVIPYDDKSPKTIFIIYVALCFSSFIATFFDQGTKALADSVNHMVCDIGKRTRTKIQWSRIRMCGSFGIGVSQLVSGLLLSHIKKILPTNIPEELCLVMLCFFVGFTCVMSVILIIPNAENKEKVELAKAIKSLVHRPNFFIILLAQFFIQFGTNFTRSYDHMYILLVGGEKYLCGLSTFIGYMVDTVFMYFFTTIATVAGSKELVVILASIIGVIRVFMYAFMDNPWLSLNNSVLIGFVVGTQLPALSLIAKGMAPSELISSYVSLLTTVGKIGAAIASKSGGSMSDAYGYRSIYLCASGSFLAAVCTICLSIYITKHKFGKKNKKNSDKLKSDILGTPIR